MDLCEQPRGLSRAELCTDLSAPDASGFRLGASQKSTSVLESSRLRPRNSSNFLELPWFPKINRPIVDHPRPFRFPRKSPQDFGGRGLPARRRGVPSRLVASSRARIGREDLRPSQKSTAPGNQPLFNRCPDEVAAIARLKGRPSSPSHGHRAVVTLTCLMHQKPHVSRLRSRRLYNLVAW